MWVCDGLNRKGPQRLLCLNAWPIGSDTVSQYKLVVVGVALLEEVCHCGGRGLGLIC